MAARTPARYTGPMIRQLVWVPFVLMGCGDKTPKQPDKVPATTQTAPARADAATPTSLPGDVPPILALLRGSRGVNTDFQLVVLRKGVAATLMKERVDGTKVNGGFDHLIVDSTKTRYMLSWLTSPDGAVPALGGHGGNLKTGAFYVGDAERGVTQALSVHKLIHAGEAFESPKGFGSADAYTKVLGPKHSFLRGRDVETGNTDWIAFQEPKVDAWVSHDGTQLLLHDRGAFYAATLARNARVRIASATKLFTLPKDVVVGHESLLTPHEVIYIAERGNASTLEAYDLTTKTSARIHDSPDTEVPRIYNEARRTLFFGGGSGTVQSYSFATKATQKVATDPVELLDVSLDGRYVLVTRSDNGVDRRLVVFDATTGQVVGEPALGGADFIQDGQVVKAVFLAK